VGARTNDVEEWFVHRGVPHLIDDYGATTDIWTRSLPLLLIAYVAGGFNALDLREWTWQRNLVASLVVVGVLIAGWVITNLLRHRRTFARPDVLGAPELAAFLIGPAIPSAIFGQWGDVVQTVVEGLAVLGAIYLLTSYAVFALLGWAARRSAGQLASLAGLVVRALPLLLLFTTFLFISTEVWQVAGTLDGLAYIVTLAIFFLLGAVFVLSRIPSLLKGLGSFDDWSDIAPLVVGTPAEALPIPSAGLPPVTPLTRRQRLNVGLVAIFSQALQITFVALLLTLFFVLFGVLAITEETTKVWLAVEQVHVYASFGFGGRTLVLTEPLLRVSAFLGAFTGMYFTVVLSTDATYRDEFAEDVGPQIRQALAVRVAYRWHLRSATRSNQQ
jgi:hypothetical protein